jgi:hypothetical protein
MGALLDHCKYNSLSGLHILGERNHEGQEDEEQNDEAKEHDEQQEVKPNEVVTPIHTQSPIVTLLSGIQSGSPTSTTHGNVEDASAVDNAKISKSEYSAT